MSYLALYRKYRPTDFDNLIGQEHIVKILQNQIKFSKIGHAYLFCGVRGTGKTSVAKIFAKAINCLTPRNGSPCGECSVCKELSSQNNIDILEIDAASNNRVDEIREIRDKVQYPPVIGKYKVYIIDEVHMLTDSAFNALLKTLEEPPAHAVFILATTEPQKLPQTILSRCMRFDFNLVSENDLEKLLEKIFEDISFKSDKDATKMLAMLGDGSVRDCLSIADKCVSFAIDHLTLKDVLTVIGGADPEKIFELGKNILQGKSTEVISIISELVAIGKSVPILVKDLTALFRDLNIVKNVAGANDFLKFPETRFLKYNNLCVNADTEILLSCLNIFLKMEADLKNSLNPKILLEACALKACKTTNDLTEDGLYRRVSFLENKLKEFEQTKTLMQSQPALQQHNNNLEPTKKDNLQSNTSVTPAIKKAPRQTIPDDKVWLALLEAIRKLNNPVFNRVAQQAEGAVKGDKLVIATKDEGAFDVLSKQENLQDLLALLNKLSISLVIVPKLIKKDNSNSNIKVSKEELMDILKTENVDIKK